MDQDDIDAVINALKGDWLTQGPACEKFENDLNSYFGSKYSCAVSNGTAALHLVGLALDWQEEDIIITSPNTFLSTVNSIVFSGATPDFVDIEPDTALMSVQALEDKLKQAEQQGNLPKIVIPVHFAGQSCDMEAISKLGKKYNFRVIEDAAHAIGARYLNRTVGCCQYSDITVFSFHPVKVITTGEGGAALTNNLDVAKKMRLLRSHGITRDSKEMTNSIASDWYYEQISLGFNYRMTDFQAALGISQLSRLDEYVVKRSKIAYWYDGQFENIPVTPLIQKESGESSHHLYVIRVKNKDGERDRLYKYLRKNDIYVNLHYIPIYRQPYFNRKIRLFGAEEYYKSAISLPIFPTIGKNNLKKVMQKISEFYEHH